MDTEKICPRCQILEDLRRARTPQSILIDNILSRVAQELSGATEDHPPLHSAHEAYSVILEKLDEFWEEIKKKEKVRSVFLMRCELVQIAAMACRTILDLNLLPDHVLLAIKKDQL